MLSLTGVCTVQPEWRITEADQICTKITKGTTPPSSEIVSGAQIPFVRVNNLGQGGCRGLTSSLIYVSRVAHEGILARSIAKPGDTLMNIVGPPLGKVALLTQDYPEYNLNQAIIIFRPDTSKVDAEFLYYFVSSYPTQQWLACRSKKTSGQQNLTIELCKQLPIPALPLIEQRKIADILRTWDEAIETCERLIEGLKARQNALVHQLVFGSRRLGNLAGSNKMHKARWLSVPVDWSVVPIGLIAEESSEINRDGGALEVLSCSKYDGFVRSLEYFKKQVFSSDLSGYKIIRRGDFGFPSNHVEEGSIGLQNLVDEGLVSPIYTTFRFHADRVDNDYAYSVLKTELYRHIFQVSTSASVDRRGSLRWSDFSTLPFPVPPIDEQRAIQKVLAAARSQIDRQGLEREALVKQKRGLMQKLLTGEWRVKIDTEPAHG